MDTWLTEARNTLARASGVDRGELELENEEVETLLELARIAAHDSGERTNAPLLCYLVGLARKGGVGLDELAGAVRRSSS